VQRDEPEPLISVVIPTINRPQLVARAVDNARRQGLREIEVIVVVDGPDEETLGALRPIDDPRLRVLPLRENVGVGGARHAGAYAARGRWIALLDDDDEWMPKKLEIQLETARCSRHRLPIITCRVIAVSQHGEVVRPQRCLTQGEALSEYLFCKTRLLGGEGLILPSTVLAPRDLLGQIRFRYRGAPFEGSDWLLRAVQHEGVGVEFVPTCEPLALWRCEDTRTRMSVTGNWRAARRGCERILAASLGSIPARPTNPDQPGCPCHYLAAAPACACFHRGVDRATGFPARQSPMIGIERPLPHRPSNIRP